MFSVEDENGKWENKIKITSGSSKNEYYVWDANNINEWKTSSLQNHINTNYSNSLSIESKGLISKTKYYLGGSNWKSGIDYGTGFDIYNWERGNEVYGSHDINWIGEIGLMYPSEFIYTYALGIDDNCFQDGAKCASNNKERGWIYNSSKKYQWLISPNKEFENYVFMIGSTGFVDSNNVNKTWYEFRPTLYLNSKVKITSGDGTQSNPYQLSM